MALQLRRSKLAMAIYTGVHRSFSINAESILLECQAKTKSDTFARLMLGRPFPQFGLVEDLQRQHLNAFCDKHLRLLLTFIAFFDALNYFLALADLNLGWKWRTSFGAVLNVHSSPSDIASRMSSLVYNRSCILEISPITLNIYH